MYKVTCLYDGTTYTLHDPLSNELRIYNDDLQTEKNEPGSFQFTVSSDHPYLDKIVGLSSDIRVYDGDEEIWRGRPIDDGEDLYRARTFKCEGELAFLFDSIQPRRELHSISPLQFFTLLIEEHNTQVRNKGPIDKTFNVGVVTVTDTNDALYRYTNRETTLDDIREKIINRLGGYVRTRLQSGKRYIDLLADVDTVVDQPIQLGENLLSYARDTDYTQVATACIPLGEALDESEIPALDAYLTVASVNNGSDVVQIETAVKKYGFICKVLNFDDITVPANLKTAGQEWLQDGQYEQMALDLTAVDMHALGYDLQPIRINTKVRVLSEPHGMDRYFEVSKRTYHLTQPETDTVSFGVTERQQSYTKSAKGSISDAERRANSRMNTKIAEAIEEERKNVSDILNLATHGYVVLDPNDGPERILIMDTNSIDSAQKIWKWDLNGLGYSKSGINGPWGVAITMNGEISADYILTGKLMAELIKVGILMDAAGVNFWNMETGEFSLASSTKVGGKTVEEIAADEAEAAVDGQTQTSIFNKLTNNGQTQGVYLKNGRLYVNATYIDTGQLVADLIKSGKITSKNGKVYFDLDNNELHCDTLVSTETNSSVSSTIAKIGHVYIGGSSENSGFGYYGMAIYKSGYSRYGIAISPDVDGTEPSTITSGESGICLRAYNRNNSQAPHAGIMASANGYVMVAGGQTARIFNSSFIEGEGTTSNGTYGRIVIHPDWVKSGSSSYKRDGVIRLNGSIEQQGPLVNFSGTLTCTGGKNRRVTTEQYGERLLYCYETTSAMFGDVGEGETDDGGECYISLDDIFSETVAAQIEYQVFLQKEGQGDIWVEEKTLHYFVVKGTPNLKFAWEVKAKQKDFEFERLEEYEHLTAFDPEIHLVDITAVWNEEEEKYIREQEEVLLNETAQ